MLYFVRHGESEANRKKLFAGQKDDSPLTDEGREQARITGLEIKKRGITFDRIVSSPLKRAYETAEIIADVLDLEVSMIALDARIQEYDMGIYTGTPHQRVPSIEFVYAEGCEDPFAFKARIEAGIRDALANEGNTLVASHAGVGRMLDAIKEGVGPEYFYDRPGWPNASVTVIDWIK